MKGNNGNNQENVLNQENNINENKLKKAFPNKEIVQSYLENYLPNQSLVKMALLDKEQLEQSKPESLVRKYLKYLDPENFNNALGNYDAMTFEQKKRFERAAIRNDFWNILAILGKIEDHRLSLQEEIEKTSLSPEEKTARNESLSREKTAQKAEVINAAIEDLLQQDLYKLIPSKELCDERLEILNELLQDLPQDGGSPEVTKARANINKTINLLAHANGLNNGVVKQIRNFVTNPNQIAPFIANQNAFDAFINTQINTVLLPGATPEEQNNYHRQLEKAFVLAAVKRSGKAFQYASNELKNNREFVLEAVKRDGGALQYAPNFQNDRDVVLVAVKQDAWVLRHASEYFRNDGDVVLVAVKQDAWVLRHASEYFRNDGEIVLEAMKGNYPLTS